MTMLVQLANFIYIADYVTWRRMDSPATLMRRVFFHHPCGVFHPTLPRGKYYGDAIPRNKDEDLPLPCIPQADTAELTVPAECPPKLKRKYFLSV